jgi:hypothetical protein
MFALMRRAAVLVVLCLLVASQAAVADEADRKAAEWAIGVGGLVRIDLGDGKKVQFNDVEQLPDEPFRIVDVNVNSKPIDDGDLALLVKTPSLRHLNLGKTAVTDEGLKHVGKIVGLEWIDVNQTRVTDRGLAHLVGLKQLAFANLQGVALTDVGLEHLSRLTAMKDLTISDSDITDDGLQHLAKLTSLERLNVAGNRLTDAGVQQLATLENLQMVQLARVLMTDVGLAQLAHSRKLKDVKITQTLVGPVGVEAFRRKRPQCKLSLDANDTVTSQGHNGSLLDRRMLALDEALSETLVDGMAVWQFERTVAAPGKPGTPVGRAGLVGAKPAGTTASLAPWTLDAQRTLLAVGYVKIEQSGDYAFRLAGLEPSPTLWVGTLEGSAQRDNSSSEFSLHLPAGYLPIAAAGYAGKGSLTVEWRGPDSDEFAPLPSDRLFSLPRRDPAATFETVERWPVTSTLPLPLPPPVAAPGSVRVSGLRTFTPVAIEQCCPAPLPSVLSRATVFAYPLHNLETVEKCSAIDVEIQRDTALYLATQWDPFYTSTDAGWLSKRQNSIDLSRDGWVHVGYLNFDDTGATRHYLYWRQCKAGERLSLRTRQYRPPVIIVPAEPSSDPLDVVPGSDLTASEAGEVLEAKFRRLFQTNRFDELEATAADYRKRRPSLRNGGTYMARLYEGIEPMGKTEEEWQHDLATLDRWMEAKPRSVTAHVAMGLFWLKYAEKVSAFGRRDNQQESQRQASERRQIAQSFVDRGRELEEKDSALHQLEMEIAVQNTPPFEEVERIIVSALAIDPADRGAILRAGKLYQHDPQQFSKFTHRVYELTRDAWGAAVYSQLVWDASIRNEPRFFDEFPVDWELAKRGFDEFIDRFPEASISAEGFAKLACYHGDREAARAAFLKFGESDGRVWYAKNYLAVWRLWARDDYLDGDQTEAFQIGNHGVKQLVWTADSDRIVITDSWKTLWLYNPQTHERLERFDMYGANLRAQLIPGSTSLLTSDYDGQLCEQDYTNGRTQHFGGSKRLTSMAVAPDGKLAATATGDPIVHLWDLEKHSQHGALTTKADINAVAFTDGGKTLVTGSKSKYVVFWDCATKEHHGALPLFEQPVERLCISADEKRLVVLAGMELSLWQLPERKKLATLELPKRYINELAISPDGTRLSAATGVFTPVAAGDVLVWNLETMKLAHTYRGHKARVTTVRFSPDGEQVASGSDDMTVRVWNVE